MAAKDKNGLGDETSEVTVESLTAELEVVKAELESAKAELELAKAELDEAKSVPPAGVKGRGVASIYGYIGEDGGHRVFYPGQILTEDEAEFLADRQVELVNIV